MEYTGTVSEGPIPSDRYNASHACSEFSREAWTTGAQGIYRFTGMRLMQGARNWLSSMQALLMPCMGCLWELWCMCQASAS